MLRQKNHLGVPGVVRDGGVLRAGSWSAVWNGSCSLWQHAGPSPAPWSDRAVRSTWAHREVPAARQTHAGLTCVVRGATLREESQFLV